jgi:hypothetical protein
LLPTEVGDKMSQGFARRPTASGKNDRLREIATGELNQDAAKQQTDC